MRRQAQATAVEKNDRGVSAAGEVVLFGAIFVLVLAGGILWGGYSLITFMWTETVNLFGRGFVVGVLVVIPAAFLMVAFYALVGRVAIWLELRNAEARQAALHAQFVQPNEDGLLPVDRRFIESSKGAEMARQLAMAQQRSKWTVADVPHSLTYAPRYNNRQDIQGAAQEAPQIALPTPQNFWQLYSAGQLPNNGFLMGHDLSSGDAINADWGKLYSALIGGQSGSGKSTLIRSILAQSALQGGRFLVLDPHYGAGAESLGASLQPLRGRMLADVAANEKQMLDTIALVRDIGQRRLAGRDKSREPVILVVDETTALLQRSTAADALTDALGEISQETRKVGVYGLCIGQTFDGRVMDTVVRNSFVSFISCRARRDVARVMTSDAEFGKAAQKLRTGEAVWMTPSGEMWTIAVPNCTQHDLELVAQHTGSGSASHTWKEALPDPFQGASTLLPGSSVEVETEAPWKGDGSAVEGAADATTQRVLSLFRDGMSAHKITHEVFCATGGRRYQLAREQVDQIINTGAR